VSAELPVHISRTELHAVEVPDRFEATGSFDVRLVNHGTSLHVHLHLDDDLSEVAALEAPNHYVEGDAERVVRVEVADPDARPEELFGRLKVVSAYGAQTRWVDVELHTPETEETVEVGESLRRPPPREPDDGGVDRPAVVVGVLGVAALAVAGAGAALLGDPLVVAGALVVFVGVVVALAVVLS